MSIQQNYRKDCSVVALWEVGQIKHNLQTCIFLAWGTGFQGLKSFKKSWSN